MTERRLTLSLRLMALRAMCTVTRPIHLSPSSTWVPPMKMGNLFLRDANADLLSPQSLLKGLTRDLGRCNSHVNKADKIYIKVKETGFAFLLRNWRQSILFDEPAVAALSASEFASRVPPQLIGGESHDHLSRALESGRFDEAIAILAQILELQNTGGYGSQYLVSSNVLISQANAGSLAVIFAKRALDAYANVDIMFDEKQGRVVMTEKMKDALLQYQDLQGLRKTGHLDYPTLSRLSGTKASTLIYSDWSTSSRRPKVVFRLLDNLLRAIKTKQYGIISLIASELAHRVSGLGKRYSQDRFLAALKNQRFDQALMVTADYVTHYKHEMQMPPERRDLIFPTGVISRKTAESLVVISAKHALGAGDDAVMFDSKQQAAVMTESMQEVVRKYQRSKGLMSTGHLDYRTLEHLAGGIPISEMMYSDWSAQ